MKTKTSLQWCVLTAVLISAPVAQAAGKTSSNDHRKPGASHAALGPAETLTGKIIMVDPESSMVIVKNSQGTTFDVVVTKATHLQSADKAIHLNDLNADINKSVSIIFVPERSGDIARSITLTS